MSGSSGRSRARARMGGRRCAVRCRPVLVRRVRPLPPPLPDVPADRRGVGVAARPDHGDARRSRRARPSSTTRSRRSWTCAWSCRACEDVCPSHVPFGRMMERARVQVEPLRSRRARFLRWLGLDVVLPHPALLRTAAVFQPIARPFLPRRMRALAPRTSVAVRRLPRGDRAAGGRGCPRDGRASSPGACRTAGSARSTSPRSACSPATAGACRPAGAASAAERSPAHNGRLDTARTLARRTRRRSRAPTT